ncbi:LysM domain receptor-like kinase 3 [Dissostichus eleginoides]|uniref:LysM domain receptor-like kinase 3 n=1 Tax=Dissostichus eleginoides TaxID=100907 RepID=A0AAD9BZW3_DISEL|nr:LysM domain receptor-like kinase 3 [Dissostichus eleginoides]
MARLLLRPPPLLKKGLPKCEEEPVPSTSSQPPTKRPRRRSSVLAFLQNQAKKDEARDAALYEQNERLVNLISELVKNK